MTCGILLIDKPEGITSFEVVRRTRRALKLRKIGHLGTLDPFATGLLPLCLGEATKLAPYLMPGPKSYRATLRLGEATDTQDLTGRVLSRTETLPEPEEVRRLAATMVGEIRQAPPMHSALHYKGERLYSLARRGRDGGVAAPGGDYLSPGGGGGGDTPGHLYGAVLPGDLHSHPGRRSGGGPGLRRPSGGLAALAGGGFSGGGGPEAGRSGRGRAAGETPAPHWRRRFSADYSFEQLSAGSPAG